MPFYKKNMLRLDEILQLLSYSKSALRQLEKQNLSIFTQSSNVIAKQTNDRDYIWNISDLAKFFNPRECDIY